MNPYEPAQQASAPTPAAGTDRHQALIKAGIFFFFAVALAISAAPFVAYLIYLGAGSSLLGR